MATANQTQPEITLFGWDTVNAVTFKSLNQAIESSRATPKQFDFTDEAGNRIQGQWGDWRLRRGGSGGILPMTCPMKSGTLTQGTDTLVFQEDNKVRIEVRLKQLNDPKYAVVDPTAKPPGPGQPAPTPAALVVDQENAVVVTSTDLDKKDDGKWKYVLQGVFTSYFNKNIGDFKHVFHVAMLNGIADQPGFQWVRPTAINYAVVDGESTDNSVFAVLAKVGEAKPERIAQQVDPRILQDLPEGANAVLAVSQEQLVQQLLLPAAAQILDKSKVEDFDITGNGLVVTNNKELTWQTIKLEDGKEVSPKIATNGFRISIVDDQIKLEFQDMTFNSPNYTLPGELIVHLSFRQLFYLKSETVNGKVVMRPSDQNPLDPNAPTGPNLESLSVKIVPTAAARNFENWMLGVGAALAAVGVVAAVFKGGSALYSALTTSVEEGANAGAQELQVIGPAAEGAQEVDEAGQGAVQAAIRNQYEPFNAPIGGDAPVYDVVPQVNPPVGAPAEGAQVIARVGAVPSKWSIAANYTMLASTLLSAPFLGVYIVDKEWFQDKYDDMSDPSKIPALNNFAANIIGASQWPNTQSWTLKDIRLAGSLLLYGDLKPADAVPATK